MCSGQGGPNKGRVGLLNTVLKTLLPLIPKFCIWICIELVWTPHRGCEHFLYCIHLLHLFLHKYLAHLYLVHCYLADHRYMNKWALLLHPKDVLAGAKGYVKMSICIFCKSMPAKVRIELWGVCWIFHILLAAFLEAIPYPWRLEICFRNQFEISSNLLHR